MSDPTSPPPPPPDWRDIRRDERWERRQFRRNLRWGFGGSWVIGLVLIVLGVIFLARNFGYPIPSNWWAFLILIPAVGSFAAAWNMYLRSGREMTPPVRGSIIAGLILTALAIMLLLGIDFGKLWPVVLILLGLGALFGGWWRPNRPMPPR
jgi:O-antigen/teichoic acid export membrane protein